MVPDYLDLGSTAKKPAAKPAPKTTVKTVSAKPMAVGPLRTGYVAASPAKPAPKPAAAPWTPTYLPKPPANVVLAKPLPTAQPKFVEVPWYEKAWDTVTGVVQNGAKAIDQFKDSFEQEIKAVREKWRAFKALFTRLNQPQTRARLEQAARQNSQVQAAYNTFFGAADQIKKLVDKIPGFSGQLDGLDDGLGFLPAILPALATAIRAVLPMLVKLIASAIAAGYVLDKVAQTFPAQDPAKQITAANQSNNDREARILQRVEAGMSYEQAASYESPPADGQGGDDNSLLYLGLVGAGLFALSKRA
jgi:hypothetical protein